MKFTKSLLALAVCSSLAGHIFAADLSITEDQKKAEKPAAEQNKKAPSEEAEFVLQLQTALQQGSLENAIALFDSMPDSLSSNADLQKLRASLLISAKKTAEAQKVIAELEQKNSSDIEIKELKIMLAKASNNSAAKSAALKELLDLDPNNASANIELGQEKVLKKKYKEARGYYMTALKNDPNNQDALFGYGQTSYYMNKIEDAKKAFNKILSLDPNSAIAYAYIGKLYAEDENYKLAEENILKAIQLDPNAYDYYMDLGTYSRFRGKFKQAEGAWSRAIQINPDYFLAYAYRAGLYDEQNMYGKALNDYRMVIKTNPKYFYAYESLGILAWHEGNYAEARASFEKAFSYYPQNISYPLIIAACMYKDKRAFEVKPFLQKVMKNYGDHESLEYLMLRLYHDLGPSNAENLITQKIIKEDNTTKKGKMSFYMALYDEIKGREELAKKMYNEIAALQSPMFFEFRLAEWKIK
ncbi:MAG: tetratricopeptide repeat protein [Treponema sp.]|nr:tetratricopeptide repeat protein [Treponema sp.]